MAIKHVYAYQGHLIAVDDSGGKVTLIRGNDGIWLPLNRPAYNPPPPTQPPPPQTDGNIRVTAQMVEAAVTSVGGSLGAMIASSSTIAGMFNDALDKAGVQLTTKNQAACLVGECAHETDWFKTFSEYGGQTKWYAPWYGRGFIQLTHLENYQGFGNYCYNRGLVDNPQFFVLNRELVATEEWAALPSVYYFTEKYWQGKNLMQICNEESSPWYRISAAINQGNAYSGYVGPSFDLRATAIDAVFNAIIITPPATGDVPDYYPAMDYLGAVTPATRTKAKMILDHVHRTLGRDPGVLWGYAAGSEHGTGRAIDVMVSQHGWNGMDREMGNVVKDYVLSMAAQWDLNWVIWEQYLYYAGGGGYRMEDRGSPTQNHMDHPHIFFASDKL